MFDRPNLGRLLLTHGVVSDEQLDQALARQQEQGGRLGETLMAMGLCSELEISRALAEQMDLPFIDLEQTPPNPRVMRLLPRELATEYHVVPVRMEGERLVVAARNPLDIRIDHVLRRATGMQVVVASGCPSQVASVLRRYDELKFMAPAESQAAALSNSHQRVDPRLLANSEQAHTVQMVDSFIAQAVRRRASEICFESRADGLHVRGCIDGHLYPMAVVPPQRAASVLARLKIMNGVPLEEAACAGGGCKVRVDGAETALSCMVVAGADGDNITLRTQFGRVRLLPLDEVGLSEAATRVLSRVAVARQGLVLVTGPKGSGRRTTLYSLLAELAHEGLKVVAIEDEVRCRVPGVTHLHAAEETAFACNLQLALGQGAHVVMLSEVPDRQTAELASRAARQGRMVLCGGFASTTLGALARFLDLGIPPNEVAAALSAIISQRLLRRVCTHCAAPHSVSFDLGRSLRSRYGTLEGIPFQKGRGCVQCQQMGVRGRIGIFEVLEVDDDFRYLLSDRFPPSVIRKHMEECGYRTLEDDAFEKAAAGVITPEEILELGLSLAQSMPRQSGPAPDSLEALAEMDTSLWELKPELELGSWDELANLASALT